MFGTDAGGAATRHEEEFLAVSPGQLRYPPTRVLCDALH